MNQNTPIIDFGGELAGPFGLDGKVAYLPGGYGSLDILVNCVGIQREEPLLEVTEAAFDEVYEVNLKSAMFLAQAAAKHQVAAERGGKQVHLLSVRPQRDRG